MAVVGCDAHYGSQQPFIRFSLYPLILDNVIVVDSAADLLKLPNVERPSKLSVSNSGIGSKRDSKKAT